MKRSSIHWRLRPQADLFLPILLALAVLAPGCVTKGRFDETSSERDQLAAKSRALEERVATLETANASLDRERIAVLNSLEDTRLDRSRLEADRDLQRNVIGALEEDLTDSEKLIRTQQEELEARREEVGRLRGTYDTLVADLETELETGRIEIEQLREGIQLNVSDEILFSSGSARLNEQGVDVLRRVADQLKKNNYSIEVRGHTDNIPIKKGSSARFATNWELAGARASRVVRLFQDEGVAGERLSAISRAEFDPVADNSTEEGRWANRRIEIRLHPVEPSVASAAQASEAAATRP